MEAPSGKHLLDYWAVLRRRRWVVYLAVSTVTLVALVGSFLATPLYRATVTLQIERQTPDVLSFRDLARVDYSWAAYSDFYQTQYKILASEAVATGAVKQLNLTSHPLFAVGESQPSLIARVRGLFPGRAGTSAETDPVLFAARLVQARLEIAPVRNSHLVQVSWVAPKAALAAQVANAVTEAYTQFNMEEQFNTSGSASEFLTAQIGDVKKQIAEIEQRLQQYGEAKKIVSIDDSSNITLKALSDIAQRRTEAQTALARAEAGYRAVVDSDPDALPEVLHSTLIGRLKEEYAGYEAQYSEKSRLFKPDWPEMQTLTSKLSQAKERLDLETQTIARQVTLAAETEYQRARKEVANLDALLRGQQEAAQLLKRDAVEFANLQGEVQKKRETLNSLIGRQNEMALSTRLKDMKETSASNIRVVDQARVPEAPFRPNKRLNLLLGVVLGLTMGVAAAFFLDHLDNTIRTAAEISQIVPLPTLAVIPHHGSQPPTLGRVRRMAPGSEGPVDLVAHLDGRAGASEAYRELRTALLLSNAGRPPRQILVTSALPEEGKSATAVNLAVVLAQLGRRVLLVDTDLRKPRLHQIFDLEAGWGMSTYLSGLEPDPVRLVLPSGVDHLEVVPSGPVPPNPSELLNSALFAGIGAKYVQEGYDHVVYDSPPALAVSDPVIIASVVEAVIVVARAGRTPRQSLKLAVEKFTQAGIRPVGIVLNDLDLDSPGYTYYSYYGRHTQPRKTLKDTAGKSRAGAV